MTLWTQRIFYVFWAERVSISKATGRSPFWMAHGVEPLFPFDLVEATYMGPAHDKELTTVDFIAARALRLMKRDEELEELRSQIYEDRIKSIRQWEKDNADKIIDYDFQPGRLILVRNTKIENELSRKTKPRYFGPMIVVKRTKRGSYILAELDGAVGIEPYAAFRLIPYYSRSEVLVPVTKMLETFKKLKEKYTKSPIWGDDGTREWEGQAYPTE